MPKISVLNWSVKRTRSVATVANDEPILEREFTLRAKRNVNLQVRVFRPTRRASGEWSCSAEILRGTKVVSGRRGIFGYDSLQALFLCLGLVDLELTLLEQRYKGVIEKWQCDDLAKLRFEEHEPARKKSKKR